MAYKQSPGRQNMPKTGRGVDAPALMTGSPVRQDNPDPVDGSFGSAFKSAKGKDFTYKGKRFSGLTKEEATSAMEYGNTNISNFKGGNPRYNASHYKTGKDTGNYEYAKYMGYDNKEISKNVQFVIDQQKKGAAALGKPMTDFKNPF